MHLSVDVHPNQIAQWKKQLLQSLPELFSRSRQKNKQKYNDLTKYLYQQISRLEVELGRLKKIWTMHLILSGHAFGKDLLAFAADPDFEETFASVTS